MAHQTNTQDLTPEFLAEDDGHTLVAISALFITVNTIFVGLRFYAHRMSETKFGLDDVVIPLAWFVNVGLCILGIVMVDKAGVGRHLAYVVHTDPTKIVSWAKSIYALEWLYLPAVALPKISILLLYLRIFRDRAARITTHILIYVVIANWIAYLVASSLQCFPFEYQWNKKIKGGRCFNIPVFYKTVSAPNIATDFVILVLPIRTIFELKTSLPRKLGLSLVFLSGSVGIIASCFRMAAFFQTEAFVDNTYASVKLVGWSIVEPGFYLLAACAIKLRPIFVAVGRKLQWYHSSISSSRKHTGSIEVTKSVRMEVMPASRHGFRKVESGEDDGSSTVGLAGSSDPGRVV